MAGLRRPQPGAYRRTTAAANLLLGVFQVLLSCCRPGGAQGQAIEPLPNVVELWQAEEGELLLPTQGDSEEDLEEPSQEQSLQYERELLWPMGTKGVLTLSKAGPTSLQVYTNSGPQGKRSPVQCKSFSEKLFTGKGLHFQPSVLDFGIQSLGHPAAKLLYAYNPSRDSEVVVNSVFTAARHFHVPPVHCRVSGVGTRGVSTEGSAEQLPNAYFLLPQVQSIQLSQTQAETTNATLLRVQLECSLHNKVCQQLKSCYLGPGNALPLEMSIVVAVENSSRQPEESTQALLDHLSIVYVATAESGSTDESAVNMYVLHSGNSLIWIQDIHHFSQKNALSLQFEPVLLPTSTTNFTKIASFVCKAGSSCDSGAVDLRKRTSSPALRACLSSPMVQGYFRVDASAAQFHIESHENATGVWSIWYRSRFDHSIILKDVSVSKEARHILKVLSFPGPLFLPPGCWNIFSLKLAVKSILLNLLTNVFLTTNTGAIFAIPLQIFSAPTKLYRDCRLSLYGTDGCSEATVVTLRNVLGMTQFASAKKSKDSEPLVSFLPRLVLEPGLVLNFGATGLRNSVVKHFVVRNPSPRPVSLQLLPLSLYPKPEAALRLLQKWFGTDMQMINFTTGEFQLTKACPYQGEPSESGLGTLHLHLQPLEMRRVGVVFTPVDYGKVTSLILIRNNLTVLDMVAVEGFGAQELLKVGGRLPGAGGSLRFKVPESTLMDCRRQSKDSKQILSITKNFKVENIGPLPVTVTSLKINGYNCQGYGFQVLDCRPFSLTPNTSRDISIVFTPDFTSSWVIRELMLVTAADLEFHFTLNVTLPHHMLPLCAEVVPGPSWEESFWRLTVFFVSLSLLGVILIAFQQAQYILMEFMKTRQRQNGSSSLQQNGGPVDVVSSHSHKSNCKNFLDTYSPPDKGRGKSCLPVGPPLSRIQNASKRSPATYGHSQKKHKCSFYYSKQKPSASVASSANMATEEKQTLTPASSLSAAREDVCTDVTSENWVSLKYASGVNVSLQKNLTLPRNVLIKEENSVRNTVVDNTSSECSMKEGPQTCMFPKETDIRTPEPVAEFKEQEPCPQKTSKKPPESPLPKSPPQYQQPDMPDVSRKHGELSDLPPDTKQQGQPLDIQENRPGTLNCQATLSNIVKSVFVIVKPSEQSELKLVCSGFERPEPSGDGRSWSTQDSTREMCKPGLETSGSFPARREEDSYYRKVEKKCADRFCSDSSSDCGSSSGSVRASRGSWGSWSSSSSDCDRKPVVEAQHFPPAGDGASPQDSPSEASIPLSLSHHICSPADASDLTQFTESSCASLPAVPSGAGEEKGLYPPGGLWPSQPVCLTSSFNCPVESDAPGTSQEPAAIPDSSFIDWSASCEGQFPNLYCPLELNDYNAFPEDTEDALADMPL
ncbi:Transmembrane protein 131-like [Microtus ochrogaster]|uniref:Transmembrane protein 131-like n=1 Tax=Microtus ochrogaster TaxID=79684 RepID=A0A8J6KKI8_MICOH|nr:Transmembrane protein 131-like [Microtus ochrogaster]